MPNLPAYMLLRQYVINLVLSHSDEEKPLPSERDLCREFQVSRTTVRNALHDLVEDGYLSVRHGSGTYVNPGRINRGSAEFRKILLLVGDGKPFYWDGFFQRHAAAIFQELQFRSASVQIVGLNSGASPAEELAFYAPDGILWLNANLSAAAARKCARLAPIQFLLGAPHLTPKIEVDDFAAGKLAAAWMRERGIQKPLLIGGDDQKNVRGELSAGWKSEFGRNGRVVRWDKCNLAELESLFSQSRPEGIFCFGTEFALVATALEHCGCDCPVLCDNTPFATSRTRRKPDARLEISPDEIGRLGARQLFEALEYHKPIPEKVRLAPTLL